ncbi:MAG: sulfurtransferase [Cyclobacteriaceae bacterium]
MSWRISSYIIVIVSLFGCTQNREQTNDSLIPEYYSSQYLIEAEDMLENYPDSMIKIIDFRPEISFNKGHITGANNVWRPDIENDSYPFGGMMAGKDKIEELFSRLGIQTSSRLIVYDDRGGCEAARLWWVLQQYNFNNIQLLNGGLDAWKKIGGMVDTVSTVYPTSTFTLPYSMQSKLSIRKEELRNKIESGEKLAILDVRTTEEFSGLVKKEGALKAGRIPGSIHLDWTVALNEQDCKKIIGYQELLKAYDSLNIGKDDLVVVYCHSGVRSAHTTFVLTELLGYTNVKNYDGSWTEWSYDENLPIVQEDSL